MYDAQTMQCTDAATTVVYSPWFPRGGDYAMLTLEVAAMSSASSSFSLTVQMIHKNASDVGDGSTVGSTFSRSGNQIATAPRVTSDLTNGFKELVRYKFTLQFSGGSGVNWAIFRMLAPIWYDAVKA